jgi:hypothetical protein
MADPLDSAGTVAPEDAIGASADSQAQPLADDGKGNHDLPEDIKGALGDLILKYEAVNRQARVEEIRKVQRQREFEKGNQNIYWSDADKKWKTISGINGVISQRKDNEELQRFDYVTNIYRPNCHIFIAVMTQNPPHVVFGPRDAASPEDVATSKAAVDVSEFIGDNNHLDVRQAEVARFYWNDGVCASYTYYDQNGETYGYREEPIIDQVEGKITPDSMKCASCGWQQDLPDNWTPDQVPQNCPQCQQPLTADNVNQGTTGMVPKVTGTNQVPLGMERIEYVGALELVRPYYSQTLEECPFITWEVEVPKARLKYLYPHAADKILAGSAGPTEAGPNATARMARLALRATSYGRVSPEGSTQLVTYRRTWFRPWSFYELDDKKMVEKLLQIFPEGCYVAFAGDQYCESYNEDLDDFWALSHSAPGDGQMRESVGGPLVDVQLRINTEENIQTETYERGIPSQFVNAEALDLDAYIAAGALPGLHVPVTPRPGQSVADTIYDSQPAPVSEQMTVHSRDLRGEVAQFITGNVPPLFGGGTGANDTASGIAMVKDSAYGRIALYKRQMNEFYAQTMLNAIECFRRNRKQDVTYSIIGAGGQLDSKFIKLEDLRGNLNVRTEANEAYPISFNQQREQVSGLASSQNPAFQALVSAPVNASQVKRFLGLGMLKIPGEDARIKKMREIQLMLTGVPVQINPVMDDLGIGLQTLKDWWASDDGQKATIENPNGAQLVLQQAEQITQILQQQMAAQAAAQAPAQPPPAQGGQSSA